MLKPSASAALVLLSAVTISAVSMSAGPASAISRYNSESLSCRQAQAAARQEGAVILRYSSKKNPGMRLYGRYVRNGLFCSGHEIAERTHVPTADRQSCPVLECKTDTRFDDDFFRRR